LFKQLIRANVVDQYHFSQTRDEAYNVSVWLLMVSMLEEILPIA